MNEDKKLVDESLGRLMEHFDSVRIFVTRHDGSKGNTSSYEAGGGNYYAQLGQVTEWVSLQDQFQRNYAKRKDDELGGDAE